jgi:hypothetical protein
VKFATDLSWVRKRRALEVATADRKSHPKLEHPFKTIPANPELANKLVVIAKKLFKTNNAKVVHDDAGYSSRFSAIGLVPIMIMSLSNPSCRPSDEGDKNK